MTPTPYLNQSAPRLLEQGIISAIGIHLQVTAISLQELLRPNPLPRFGVIENHHRMLLIPAVRPDPSRARVRQLVVEHLYARIVGPDHFGLEQHSLSGPVQRRHQAGDLSHPTAHCLTRNLHPMTLEDFLLPVQRHMVGRLGYDHLRPASWPRRCSFRS